MQLYKYNINKVIVWPMKHSLLSIYIFIFENTTSLQIVKFPEPNLMSYFGAHSV